MINPSLPSRSIWIYNVPGIPILLNGPPLTYVIPLQIHDETTTRMRENRKWCVQPQFSISGITKSRHTPLYMHDPRLEKM